MPSVQSDLAKLLACGSRGELQAALARLPRTLSLPELGLLLEHVKAQEPEARPVRLAIVHTYTSDLLQPWLSFYGQMVGLDFNIYHAPYGLALLEASPGSSLVAHRPQITLMMLRQEDLHPDLARPIVGLGAKRLQELRLACLARIREIVGMFRAQPVGQIVLTILPSIAPPSLGIHDAQISSSEAQWWSQLRAEIAQWIREACPSTVYLDLDDILRQVGRAGFFDRRFWYSARYPFAAGAAMEFSRRVAALGALLNTPRVKVLVLDADNTLWGGVVGEDGIDGIALGPDYPGNAFVDFQRRILDMQQRGLLLALCSKNNARDVQAVLKEHPHQVLRSEHFAAQRVNWQPKVENLESLAAELNVNLESFVFVDDSDHECASVQHQLPQVEVVRVPGRVVDVPTCLDHVARLEVLSLTAEDLAKTEMYAREKERKALGEEVVRTGGSAAEYLARLEMQMQISINADAHTKRLSQLSQKTNQFNLTTRRYDELQIAAFIAEDRTIVFDFSLADIFGDSGIVGLAIWRVSPAAEAELDTLLMSCRVIGREAESAFFEACVRSLHQSGIVDLVADYLPTAKNDLVRGFLEARGFTLGSDGRFRRNLLQQPPCVAGRFPIDVVVATELNSTKTAMNHDTD